MPGSLEQFRDRVGEVVLSGVDLAVESRWDDAKARAAATTGSIEERVEQARQAVAREVAAVGAAAGAVAAAPAIGTMTSLGTAATEMAWFTTRAADLILTVAAIHGHTEASTEQRRAWVLSVLAFGGSAAAGFTSAARQLGKGVRSRSAGPIPAPVLRSVNSAISRTLVTRYGAKRGVAALGRALPVGIGAVIGGSANYSFARVIGHQAHTFFRDLPPDLAADE